MVTAARLAVIRANRQNHLNALANARRAKERPDLFLGRFLLACTRYVPRAEDRKHAVLGWPPRRDREGRRARLAAGYSLDCLRYAAAQRRSATALR